VKKHILKYEKAYYHRELFMDKNEKNIIVELKKRATSICKIMKPNTKVRVGLVASAIYSSKGNIYTGVSIEVSCGMGFCAEHSAIAEMLKNKESEISYVIAVSKNGIIPPCGRCRELIRQVNKSNINTLVIVSEEKVIPLSELLPIPYVTS
jgi:cytidine deaminase